jgi:hypothetical protein
MDWLSASVLTAIVIFILRELSEITRRKTSTGRQIEAYKIVLKRQCELNAWAVTRAFDEKVESMMGDSHDGANRIEDSHWYKGASHEWGSLIPTICVNVWLRQSKPVIPV